jgi:hypothetical protein
LKRLPEDFYEHYLMQGLQGMGRRGSPMSYMQYAHDFSTVSLYCDDHEYHHRHHHHILVNCLRYYMVLLKREEDNNNNSSDTSFPMTF